MEDRNVADVVCPVCGLPIEVAQQFVRPNDNQEYMTVRCMGDHYVTIKVDDMDLLIVGAPAVAELYDDDEAGLD